MFECVGYVQNEKEKKNTENFNVASRTTMQKQYWDQLLLSVDQTPWDVNLDASYYK